MTNRATKALLEFGKKIAFRHTSLGRPTYPYNVEPIQLSTLIMEVERLRDVKGAILEIGVARGMTTRFLAEHIALSGRVERLIAIDTFSSFVESDLRYEAANRGKSPAEIAGFAYNDYATWLKNFEEYEFVEAIQSDCTRVNYASLGPIKLVFLDVDLYLPTKKTLPLLFDALLPSGCILLDDIKEGGPYDGAYQAYMEFCKERSISPQIVGTKCGIIRKTNSAS